MKKETLDWLLIALSALIAIGALVAIYALWTLNFALLAKFAAVWISVIAIAAITLMFKGGS